MSGHKNPQAGFTFLEMMIAIAVGTIVMWIMTSVVATTGELNKESRIQTRAHAEHRRNLESLSTIIREIDNRTLTEANGFDLVTGVATAPSFQRVSGIGQVVSHRETENLVWRPSPRPVDGVANPGAVWLVSPSGERMVADRVPQDGFALRRQIVPLEGPVDPKDPPHPEEHFGSLLTIRLTTYYSIGTDDVTSVTSETGVVLRNFFVLSEGK